MTTYILDGIWGTHRRWESLRYRIEKSIGPCKIWRYDNSGLTSLEKSGHALRQELSSAEGPFNLIGYSMGGLVVRESLRGASELPVHRAAFLHCPHRGTLAAHAFPLPACREMRPGSAFLSRLNSEPWSIPTMATWCSWDAVVVPGISARWVGAKTILHSHMPAHAWPVISPGIHNAILRFFQQDVAA